MRVPRPDLSTAAWRKSSYSNSQGGDCLEVADGLRNVVPVRDSKRPHAPAALFTAPAWTAFVTQVRNGARRPL
ncbi:regulatory protein [Streptomyces sp. 150FB]|uniref:DUF397 domain-containing protein n=1 Tax=Streptomyces sp. 150FB TaxID=1576605 RepID=UPI0005896760|nr:DUF397 domain-containing protein [Streptomyces sp. 150FB]KIF75977.1 regulatory protein [Streptomyces sp. 150FB]